MNFDWACIYSDDKNILNKGHQYRNGTLKLDKKIQSELKSIFYIPTNFPDIPILSGQWINSISKFAIASTQILPAEGRTSYITFIIFIDEDSLDIVVNLDCILKFLTNDPYKLKSISDNTNNLLEISINSFFNNINDSTEKFIDTIFSLYSKKQIKNKVVIADGFNNIDIYINFLSNLWGILIPSLRKDFSWNWVMRFNDLPLNSLPNFIFTSEINWEWKRLISNGNFMLCEYQENNILLNSYKDYLFNSLNLFSFYNGPFNELYHIFNLLEYKKYLDNERENLILINYSLSFLLEVKLLENKLILNSFYIEKLRNDFSDYLSVIVINTNNSSHLKRFFADSEPLVSNELMEKVCDSIVSSMYLGEKLDKAILGHALKFFWVKKQIINIFEKLANYEFYLFKSLLTTLIENLKTERENVFFEVLEPHKNNLFDSFYNNFLNHSIISHEMFLHSTDLNLFFYGKKWFDFCLIFLVYDLYVSDEKTKKFKDVVMLVEQEKYLNSYAHQLMQSYLCAEEIVDLYLTLDDIYQIQYFSQYLISFYNRIAESEISLLVIKIWLNILSHLSNNEKKEIFTQSYFDKIVLKCVEFNSINLISDFMKELNFIDFLNFYNFNEITRLKIWVLPYSLKFLRPTSIAFVNGSKPFKTIEGKLFEDIIAYLDSTDLLELNPYLITYLKSSSVILSIKNEVVFRYLVPHMTQCELSHYLKLTRKDTNFLENLVKGFKSNRKQKYKKLEPYHQSTILNELSFNEQLEACFPEHLSDVKANLLEWKTSFIECLTHLISNRNDLEIICENCSINYKKLPTFDTLYNFIVFVINKVFDANYIDPMKFINSAQTHFGITNNYDYSSNFSQYKLFVMLKYYYLIKLRN
ncbi:TPA: hypothetical protein JI173_00050 [Acinetobacter baumannii]|nr:hypothetical protein [Acinetobacter baumannii]